MISSDKIGGEIRRYTLKEICQLLVIPIRRARHYIQLGLVDRPEGIKRGAFYLSSHLRQFQHIQHWQDKGVSLERIAELIQQGLTPTGSVPIAAPRRGDVKLQSQIHIAPGVDLTIDQEQAQLSPEQTQDLYRQIGDTVDQLKKNAE